MRGAVFGCGDERIQGYEHYDLIPSSSDVTKLDMNVIPFDFSDNTFDSVICRHTLEHLDRNPYDVIKEFYRIVKPNGKVIIELPIFGNLVSHNRWYHSSWYMNPVLFRKKDNKYIKNLFVLVSFKKKQKCSIRKTFWKMKRRFCSWVDSFRYDSYEWTVKK